MNFLSTKHRRLDICGISSTVALLMQYMIIYLCIYFIYKPSVHCFANCPSAQLIDTLVTQRTDISKSDANCECSQIQEGGWEIMCFNTSAQTNSETTFSELEDLEIRFIHYSFFIRYETDRHVKITCDTGAPVFKPALFQGFGIEAIDSFSIENCPLPQSLPLSVVLHRTASVSSIHPKAPPKTGLELTTSSDTHNSLGASETAPEISKVRTLSVIAKHAVSLQQLNNLLIGLESLETLKLSQFLIKDFTVNSTAPIDSSNISNHTALTNHSRVFIESNKRLYTENPFTFAENFPNLKALRLQSFIEDSVPEILIHMLNGLTKLEFLELESNNLSVLSKGTFSYAGKSLKKLYLYRNRINKIDLNAFANLSRLEIIDLSNNKIQELSPNSLQDLKSLVYFSIKYNLLSRLPEDLFKHNPRLNSIDLSSNRNLQTFPVNLLKGLDQLANFSASYCQLTHLSASPQTFFRNAPNLESIRVEGNLLVNLTIGGLFGGNPRLSRLDFSNNKISQISRDIFSQNSSQINELIFYGNQIETLPDSLFSQLRNIRKLNFANNRLRETSPQLFLPLQNLEELNLSQNKLTTINSEQNRIPFGLGPKLRKVNLADNHLTDFERDFNSINWSLYLNIAELDLRYNKFVGRLRVPVFSSSIAPIINLDLSHNNFTSVDIQDVLNYDKISLDYTSDELNGGETRRTSDSIKTNIWETHIRLDRNPIQCNCFLEPFLNYVKTYQSSSYPSRSSEITYRKSIFLIESEEFLCEEPHHLKDVPIGQLELSQLICVIEDQNICPSSCDCVYQSTDKTVVIDCDRRGLRSLPQELVLSNYYNISLEHNTRIQTINGVVLQLRHNHIEDIESINRMFIWVNKLIKKPSFVDVYFDNNSIAEVHEDIVPQFYSFKNSSLPLIRVLSLRDNRITSMSLSVLKNFDSFASHLNAESIGEPKIYLGNNPFDCHNERALPGSQCQIRDFKSWLTSHYERIGDLNAIQCDRTEYNSSATIIEIPDDVLCPILQTAAQNDKLLLTLTIVCIVLAISLFVVSVLYYRNKQTILAFIYIHFNPIFICLSFSEEDLDEDKVYDAFVSYSSADRDVVMSLIEKLEKPDSEANLILHNTIGASVHEGLSDQIIPENEFRKSQKNLSINHNSIHSKDVERNGVDEDGRETHLKLCIHERDWLPGNLISWNIVNSVQNSKRTILVLSKDFIESIWFQIEFHTAYYQMLEDKIDRLIVVVKGQLPPKEELDKDLVFLLTTKTYLVWGEKWFWEKLRYALPHKKIINELKSESKSDKTIQTKANGLTHNSKSAVNANKSSEVMKDFVDKKIANHFQLNSFANNTTKTVTKTSPKSLRNSSTIVTQSNPRLKRNGFENQSFVIETHT